MPMRHPLRAALAAALASVAVGAHACDFCLVSQGVSPLDTVNGRGLRLSERYTELDRVYEGTRELDNPGARERYYTTEVTGFWTPRPWLTLLGVLPFRVTEVDGHLEHRGGHHHHDEDGGHHEDEDEHGHDDEHAADPAFRDVEDQHGGDGGLGDISLLARARLFQRHTLTGTTTVAVLAGVKLPTGNTDGRADGGDYLDAHLQLGSGAVDGLFGAAFSHVQGRWGVAANLLGAVKGQGEAGNHDYDYGDSLNYDLTLRYRVSPADVGPSPNRWFLTFGVAGELRGQETEAGSIIDDSGGHVTFVQPGMQFNLGGRWLFEVSAQVPVRHDLAGTQLGEDLRVVGSITVLL